MSEDNAYPEKWRQLEYVGERGTWSPDRTMSYACEERIKYDQIEKENQKIMKDNDRLFEKAAHLEYENKTLRRRHAKKGEYIKKLEDKEILKSTQTADKHRNDPDIDKFDEMNKLE